MQGETAAQLPLSTHVTRSTEPRTMPRCAHAPPNRYVGSHAAPHPHTRTSRPFSDKGYNTHIRAQPVRDCIGSGLEARACWGVTPIASASEGRGYDVWPMLRRTGSLLRTHFEAGRHGEGTQPTPPRERHPRHGSQVVRHLFHAGQAAAGGGHNELGWVRCNVSSCLLSTPPLSRCVLGAGFRRSRRLGSMAAGQQAATLPPPSGQEMPWLCSRATTR